ncbi:BTAD domain-containing putative transcriptional regulator [Deinococcus ruber]|uniref:BTAD domain-containing putative transcriptional regulator n=1 Tax=Deinococcus ruber TaxID=1848197 RepID=UPI001668C936|nr:BTAD domain-containing putative transcriptional regulator [Deinococcus ruber]
MSAYGRLQDASATDERWAGLCLLNVGRPLEARALLTRSLERGCMPAAIELATVYRQLGEPELGRQTLQTLTLSELSTFDHSLAELEWGISQLAFGDLRGADEALERAWNLATQTEREGALLPGIGLTLGYVCMAQGADQRALQFVTQALEHAEGLRLLELQTVAGACYTAAGRFYEAEATFKAAGDVTGPGAPTLLYHRAMLARYRGHTREALALFQKSAQQAQQLAEAETECAAELGLVAVHCELGETRRAAKALAHASALHVPARISALVDLRRGQLMMRNGEAAAIEVLTLALKRFGELQLHRERGWAALHLAEAYLTFLKMREALDALEEAHHARAALCSSPVIALELRAVPQVLSFLQAETQPRDLLLDWWACQEQRPRVLRIQTLGGVRLTVNGQTVRPNASLDKSTELLVYLLLHPNQTREQILAAIFPEKYAVNARIYFHLMRSELAKIVDGLTLPYDRETRAYRVEVRGMIVRLDLHELKQILYGARLKEFRTALEKYIGPFLPESETDWVVAERTTVEWLMVRTGLDILEESYQQGEDALCMDLAEQLLQVEPLNEGINTLLIRATERLKGAVTARHTLERVRKRFRDEVGELPTALQWTSLD